MVVLISLFHYDNFALRLLFSYLQANNVPVHYISFKRMKQKATTTLKNDYVEMHDFHDPVTDEDVNALLAELDRLSPSLIGIGVQSIHLDLAKKLTAKIKNKFTIPVVWGGVHPTIDPSSCINHTDIVCVGEGFDALVELSKNVMDGQPYNHIQNLWINKNGHTIINSPRPLMNNLDILPFASYTPDNKLYIDNGRVENEKNIDYFGFGFTDTPRKTFHQTMTSFGCPMRCSFCFNCLDYERFRRRSVENVIEELIEVKEKNKDLRMVIF